MTVHNIETEAQFRETIEKYPIVLIDFFATWSGPCKVLAPLVAVHSNDDKYNKVYFGKVNVDQLSGLTEELGVRTAPSLMLYKNANKANQIASPSADALTEFLDKAIA